MKKTTLLLSLIFVFALFFGCSTSNDGNGNTTTAVIPLAPTNLNGQLISATQINLTWIDNSTNETGFKIERKTGTGPYAIIGTTTADNTNYNDTSATPNSTYTYRVYSFNTGGNSINYSNEFTQTITAVSDIDGNYYLTTSISNTYWTTKNLTVTHYRNGDIIPQVTDPTQWQNLTTGAWCYYNNDPTNEAIYGKLYNWYAATDPRGLAPTGYHIPSDNEWTTLSNYLGGVNVAGGKLKATGITLWQSPNLNATNSSGFNGIPGGNRNLYGTFYSINQNAYWISSSLQNAYCCGSGYVAGYGVSVNKDDGTLDLGKLHYDINGNDLYAAGNKNAKMGLSVRCVKD